jgi:glucosamine--fructose-6-phosphate aminotransferase (isomerizing)
MCGIIGILGSENSYQIILEGLKQLQNRGYDSSGICLYNKTFHINKFVSDEKSAICKLEENIIPGNFFSGIGHTRWATHGGITESNCHPHLSNDKEISLVHNGIIENYKELKNFLIDKGYTFYSETDTEVICNLISYFRKKNNMIISLKKTINLMSGTWGIVIIEKNNNRIYFTRRGSPLLLGYDNNKTHAIITSEKSGFNNSIKEYISIKNNDICYLDKINNKVEFFSEKVLIEFDQNYLDYEHNFKYSENFNYNYSITSELNLHLSKFYKKIVNKSSENDNSPGEYIYWTLKEIEEQKDSCLRALNMGSRIKKGIQLGGIEQNTETLKKIENLIILGCGTSYNAGLFISKYFKEHCNFNFVNVIDGADFNYNEIPKKGKTACIFLSQSGETLDLIRCIEICKKKNVFTIGVVNVVDSTIARETDCGCYLNAGREVGVASTKAFTSQIIVLMTICLWFHEKHYSTFSPECINILNELNNISNIFSYIIDSSRDLMGKWSLSMLNEKSVFILGKDECYAIARESSLKIKEISYIHAESSPASALKHGPFGLLEKNFHVILIDIGEDNRSKMNNVYNEIFCRGAEIYTITDDIECKRDNCFILKTKSCLNSILSIIPLQFLSFYLSVNKKINPDYPRNLAKVVTVE